jgi:hypothetical protein
MHSCGNTAVNGCSWPNFWANLASFSLNVSQPARDEARGTTGGGARAGALVSLHGGPVPARRHSLYSIFRYKAGAMAPVLGTEGAAHAARGAVGRGHASLLAILDVSFSLGVITQCGAAERVTVDYA